MKELTLSRVEEIKAKVNERMKGLGIDIEVQSSFVMMVGLLIEELLREQPNE